MNRNAKGEDDTEMNPLLKDKPKNDKFKCLNIPRVKFSLDYLSFGWIYPLLQQGFHRQLGDNDLPDVPSEMLPEKCGQDLWNLWIEECDVAKSHPSFYRVLAKAYGFIYAKIGLIKLINDSLSFATPFFLHELISYLDDDKNENSNFGIFCAFSLGLVTLIKAIFSAHYSFEISKLNLKIKAAIMSIVFRKSLSIDSFEKEKFSDGEILNLFSVDCEKIINLCPSLHELWSLPFQIILALYLLYHQLKYSFVSGFVIVIILIPINRFLAYKISSISEQMMHKKDERIRLTSEILSSIKTIKLFCWENFFYKKINFIRSQEMNNLAIRKYLDAFCVFFWATTPIFFSFFSFFTYIYFGNELNAAKVFTSMTLFNILLSPLNSFPWVINGIVEANISVKRLTRFLSSKNFESKRSHSLPLTSNQSQSQSQSQNTYALDSETENFDVIFSNAFFSWESQTMRNKYKNSINNNGNENEYEYVSNDKENMDEESGFLLNNNISKIDDDNDDNDDDGMKKEKYFCLKNLNFKIPKASFVVICGKVGSGKSSILESILGEMNNQFGNVYVNENISYVPQIPWIQLGNIRQNILFNEAYDDERYFQILHDCCLLKDISIFRNFDFCEIGEKGLNLSGGQKTRIALARAMYKKSEIILMDDIFSSLDIKVSNHILKFSILGKFLKNRTRILCTHNTNAINLADYILLMENGQVKFFGNSNQFKSKFPEKHFDQKNLTEKNFDEKTFDQKHFNEELFNEKMFDGNKIDGKKSNEPIFDENILNEKKLNDKIFDEKILNEKIFNEKVFGEKNIFCLGEKISDDFCEDKNETSFEIWGKNAIAKLKNEIYNYELMEQNKNEFDLKCDLIESEFREEGNVKLDIYKYYIKCVTYFLFLVIITSLLLMQISKNGNDLFLSYYLEKTKETFSNHLKNNFLKLLSIFAICNTIFTLFRSFFFAFGGIKAAKTIHENIFKKILFSKISFFDQTPTGRIINRFSSDQYSIDDSLPFIANIFLANFFNFLGIFFILLYSQFSISIILIPLVLIYFELQKFYRSTAREVRRIENVSKSPIYSFFNEVLDGRKTIRAFKSQNHFIKKNDSFILKNQKANFTDLIISFWLFIRLQIMSSFLILFISLFSILTTKSFQFSNMSFNRASLAGLCLSYSLPIINLLNDLLTSFAQTEKEMISVERIKQYTELEEEVVGDCHVSNPDWPTHGCIQFCQVSLRYRPDLPFAIRNLSFTINGGEKVAVAGRTGAGKSTLLSALFRLYPSSSGQILIDEYDVATCPLHEIRSKLCIIPQAPFLFQGSIKENLDPENLYSDEVIHEALSKCHLAQRMHEFGGIHETLNQSGHFFSLGEKQLLCFARALLKKSKIMVMDEFVANVDPATSSLLNDVIRFEFEFQTVLVIAHRLKTLLTFPRMLLIQDGALVEDGNPNVLISNPASKFAHFAKLSQE